MSPELQTPFQFWSGVITGVVAILIFIVVVSAAPRE